MPNTPLYQYQIKTEPPPAFLTLSQLESTWHQPWSEPVRFRIAPRMAIALAASGLFAPVLNPDTQITQNYESRWHYAWSEPIRIKPGLGAYLQQPLAYLNPIFQYNPRLATYPALSLPVWPKRGIGRHLQQSFVMPPRLLPPVNLTVTMTAIEINKDTALFGVSVGDNVPKPYVLFASANVTVSEIPAISGGALSIEEES